MRDDVMQHITSLNEQNKIIAHIENNFTGCLLQKKHNPYTEIDYSAISHMEYLDAVQSFEAMLQSLYKIVEEHNRRVSQFEKIRNNAKNMLIALEISQFFDKNKNYANSETFYHLRLSKLTPSHNIYEKQIEKLDEELLDFKAPI
ncbi:MAG: hypothetical protein R3Y54_14295 [Eubacteriales bacterium]